MEKPLALVRRILVSFWDDMFNLMICNLLWFLAQVLVITGPPATAALFKVTNAVANGRFARVSDFRAGFQQHFVNSWKWGAMNLVAILIFVNAALFYGSTDFAQPAGVALSTINLCFLAAWLVTQMLAFPFWLEQDEKRIALALRNALITQAQNMGHVFLVTVLAVVAIAISVLVPVLIGLLTASFLTLMGNTVVVAKLESLAPDEGDSPG